MHVKEITPNETTNPIAAAALSAVTSINRFCLLQQTHSVILTSGTLSPLRSLEAELGRSFSKRLLPPALVGQNVPKEIKRDSFPLLD